MLGLAAEGFSLGLSTGLYCLGACAPLFVPYLLAESRGWSRQVFVLAQFMAGRLAAYLLFGAAAGWAGARFQGPPFWAEGPGIFLSGLALLLFGLAQNAPRLRACLPPSFTKTLGGIPFLLGFLLGINICPPFIAGLIRLFALKSAALGALYFAAFFAGTTLYMLPLAATVPLSRLARLKNIAAVASLLSGLWFMSLGLIRIL